MLLQHLISYVTYINGIVVSAASCVAVLVMRILPGLQGHKMHVSWWRNTVWFHSWSATCLWNGSIIPDVAFVRKHVGYVTEVPILHVLFQWI